MNDPLPDAPNAARIPARPRLRPGPIATALAAVLLLGALWMWSGMLLMAFGAVLIAIALRAGGRYLDRVTGLGVKPGVLVTALAAILVMAGVIALAGPSVAAQFRELVGSLPDAWDQIAAWMSDSAVGRFAERLVESRNGGGASATSSLPSVVDYLKGTLGAVFGGLANLVLVVTVAIFLALDTPMYRHGALRLVPFSYRRRASDIADELGDSLASWMGGQAVDMLGVGVVIGLGLWLLDVPLALVLGLIAGLTNVVPIVGPFLSGVPAVLFALTQGFDLAIYVALLFLVVQQIEGNVLMPMIQGFVTHLPPALTVLAIVAFGSLFGFAGVLLATPLLLVAMVLVKRIYVEDVLGDRLDR